MAISPMYEGMNNSPQTDISAAVTSSDQVIPVTDITVFPTAPNLATLGTDEDAEVIRYNGIDGSTLTGCERGFGGTTAKSWDAATIISRQITKYDLDSLRTNIADLDARKANADDLGGLATLDTVNLTSNVTGKLPIANGGTNAATRTGAVKSLFNEVMLNSTTHILGIKSDWSMAGYISLVGLRNILGLGNTTDALPAANGGTGVTSLADLLTTLGFYYFSISTSNTGTYTIKNNIGMIMMKRGALYGLILFDYWTAGYVTVAGNFEDTLTITKTSNSREITITNNGGYGSVAFYLFGI